MHIILNVSDNKPRVLYITDVMTTYRTMSLNLSLWFLCCKLKIFVKARLTNLFRVIIKFRRREKIYASAIYIWVGVAGSWTWQIWSQNKVWTQSFTAVIIIFIIFFGFFSKSTRERKNCVWSARDQRYIFIQYGARVYIRFCLLGEKVSFFFGWCMYVNREIVGFGDIYFSSEHVMHVKL